MDYGGRRMEGDFLGNSSGFKNPRYVFFLINSSGFENPRYVMGTFSFSCTLYLVHSGRMRKGGFLFSVLFYIQLLL